MGTCLRVWMVRPTALVMALGAEAACSSSNGSSSAVVCFTQTVSAGGAGSYEACACQNDGPPPSGASGFSGDCTPAATASVNQGATSGCYSDDGHFCGCSPLTCWTQSGVCSCTWGVELPTQNDEGVVAVQSCPTPTNGTCCSQADNCTCATDYPGNVCPCGTTQVAGCNATTYPPEVVGDSVSSCTQALQSSSSGSGGSGSGAGSGCGSGSSSGAAGSSSSGGACIGLGGTCQSLSDTCCPYMGQASFCVQHGTNDVIHCCYPGIAGSCSTSSGGDCTASGSTCTTGSECCSGSCNTTQGSATYDTCD